MHYNIMTAVVQAIRPPMLHQEAYAHVVHTNLLQSHPRAGTLPIDDSLEWDEIYSTVDASKNAHDMWIAIERLQQVSSSTSTRLVNEFVTIVKQNNDLDTISYHKLFNVLKQCQKEVNAICAERIAKNANPLALRTVTVAGVRETVGSQSIANLKLDIDENKKIQKQLKKANASLTHELKECKSILAETSRTLGEYNSTRDSCLIALQSKQTELETYMTLNDRIVDYEKLEHKLNEILGLLAEKEININKGLKLRAIEILVVKEKHDELVKHSLLTKSHYEGLVKEKLILRIAVIMEYLVKISKKARILELKRRHLKITVLKSNMPYPLRKIRRICACTSPKTTKDQGSIRRIQRRSIRLDFQKIRREEESKCIKVLDNPNITMEEFIRLEEEKAFRHGKVYNWETAMYGKIWYDEDFYDLRSVETEFPSIVFNDELSSEKTFSCEPTVSSLNQNEIDFRISFDESDDEDYMVTDIAQKDKNKAKRTKPSTGMEKSVKSRSRDRTNIAKITRKGQKPDENEHGNGKNTKNPKPGAQNYLNNGMLLNLIKNLYVPFGIPFDPKRYYKDDVYTRILRRPRKVKFCNLCTYLVDFTYMAPLPPRDQRHLWLRYQVEGYTEEIVHDFEDRLETIFRRQVNQVHVLDFEGLTPKMRQDLAERLRMVYTGDDGQEIFMSHAWRRLFEIRAPLVREFILEFFSTYMIGLHTAEEMTEDGFKAYWLGSERVIPDKGDLSDYWIEISSDREFLRATPSYTYIRDPLQRPCHRLISYNISGRGQAPKKVTATDLFYLHIMDRGTTSVPYLLAQYLFKHAEGRKSGSRLSGGHFIGRLAHHFGLVSDDGLRELSVVTRDLPLIDMGAERQPVAAVATPWDAEDALDVDEGA
ncbi:hypothetical protein Tco_1194060 [Tanacetum coccineum]